jgi:hypothetical protein
MTLPAFRYRDRVAERKKTGNDADGPPFTISFDYDETITQAPAQLARIATGLKAQGDTIIVLTGNESPAKELEGQLEEWGFPFDALVQYHDEGTNGIARAEHLKAFGAWLGIDNRIDRCYTYAKVCPTLYLITKPTKEEKDDAAGTKKTAKQDAKQAAKEAQS